MRPLKLTGSVPGRVGRGTRPTEGVVRVLYPRPHPTKTGPEPLIGALLLWSLLLAAWANLSGRHVSAPG